MLYAPPWSRGVTDGAPLVWTLHTHARRLSSLGRSFKLVMSSSTQVKSPLFSKWCRTLSLDIWLRRDALQVRVCLQSGAVMTKWRRSQLCVCLVAIVVVVNGQPYPWPKPLLGGYNVSWIANSWGGGNCSVAPSSVASTDLLCPSDSTLFVVTDCTNWHPAFKGCVVCNWPCAHPPFTTSSVDCFDVMQMDVQKLFILPSL